MKSIIFILLISSLLFLGCMSGYVPVKQGNVEISGDFAIIRSDATMLAVKIDLWTGEPQFLPDYFTTINVRVQNRTRENIRIEPSHFAVLDEHGLQSDTVSLEMVLDVVLSHHSLIPDRFAIAVETQRENQNRINNIRRNIMSRSFAFGELLPGATKEGVLFFPKIDNKNQEFVFIYNTNEILFKKTK